MNIINPDNQCNGFAKKPEDKKQELFSVLSECIKCAENAQPLPDRFNELKNEFNMDDHPEIGGFLFYFQRFLVNSTDRYNAEADLAMGNLNDLSLESNYLSAPIKQLYSDLQHLVWQTKRIADGDYNQRVFFLGDFSSAYNSMIDSLKEKKRLEENLITANKTKDKFFSIIAHDLKNPFNVILGLTKMLIDCFDRYDEEEKKEYLGMILEKTQVTFKLLENLLLWAKAQRNNIDYNPQLFKVKDLADEVSALMSLMIQNKEISFEVNIPQDLEIKTDKSIFSTILRNLLTNAVKFSHRKSTIFLSAEKNDTSILLKVKDQGVGMTPEQTEKLFRVHENSSRPGTEQEAGTGLGIILCSELISICQGTIAVESRKDEGTLFTLCFPV